ncbi:MAG: histidine--tRNA ligase [Patescibacteria group bacterium]
MNNQVQPLKGFRDFIGADARKRQWLTDNIRLVFERFGYEPLETPTLEYESLLMGKYGDEADKLIYSFEDRGARRVAMRYDQTIPTARIVAQYQNELVFPYKRYQIQPVWRADKPQKGRYREFLQCDADIIGTRSVASDAEILSVYAAIYAQIGITSLQIKINDRETLINKIKDSGISEYLVFSMIQTIDKLDKKSRDEVLEELERKNIGLELGKKLLDSLESSTMPQKIEEIISLAEKMGTKRETFVYAPTLARGLDYYTGMIFEGVIPEYEVGSVGGGGRYDKLLNELVGVDQPAVGFGLGFDRTLEAAELLGKVPQDQSFAKVLVTIFSPDLATRSMETANLLQKENIATEIYLDPEKKLDAQLKYANKKGIPFVVIIGPEEAQNNQVKVKNMKTGEQSSLAVDELKNFFQN